MSKKERFVETDVYIPPAVGEAIFAAWRAVNNWRTPNEPNMPFEEYRDKFILNAIAERVWRESPKTIVAGTDGSIRIEAV